MGCARSMRPRARRRRISHRRSSTPPKYYQHVAWRADPARAQRGSMRRREIQQVWEESLQSYGVRNIWRQLAREGTQMARCTAEQFDAPRGSAAHQQQ
jgi:hypothetical protein